METCNFRDDCRCITNLCKAGVLAPKAGQRYFELVPVALCAGGLDGLAQDDIAAAVQLLLCVLEAQFQVLWDLHKHLLNQFYKNN